MSDYRMEKLVLGMVQTNCYIVWNDDSREAFVVDPADSPAAIAKVIKDNNLKLTAILLTHGHFDHITGVPGLKELFNVPVYAGIHENVLLNNDKANLSNGWGRESVSFDADHYLKDGEEFEVAGFKIKTIETPGHTIGGVCYYLEDEGQLFCGDTLFYRSYGRTDLYTGDEKALKDSLINKLFKLPHDTIAYPGHDRGTDIGFESEHNMIVMYK